MGIGGIIVVVRINSTVFIRHDVRIKWLTGLINLGLGSKNSSILPGFN